MIQRPLTRFRKTCIAAAVAAAVGVATSACSTTPRNGDDGVGGTLADAGRTTLDAGTGIWERTMYLLGFTEEAKREAATTARPTDGELLDEVDLALMEEDAVMPETAQTTTRAAEIVRSPEWSEIAGTDEIAAAAPAAEAPDLDGVEPATEAVLVGASDLTHEVGESETLWDIAKATTGDATNWHVLADVNDLAPDAAVYPGQTLRIPADMVRPELAGFATSAEASAATAAAGATEADTDETLVAAAGSDGAAAGGRLAIPGTDGGAGEPADADPLPDAGVTFNIESGETLWDFAKRTTGDATNWETIADANGFTEREATRVREGQTIVVPSALVRRSPPAEDAASTTAAADVPAEGVAADAGAARPIGAGDDALSAAADGAGTEPARGAATEAASDVASETTGNDRPTEMIPIADAADVTGPGGGDAATASEERLASADASGTLSADTPAGPAVDATQPIRIVEAAFRSEPDAGAAETEAASAVAASLPSEVMVSGTYYPKAVYNDADFASSLLMRVSPGTTLQVSRALGPWFEVQTEQGTGYVHARDIK